MRIRFRKTELWVAKEEVLGESSANLTLGLLHACPLLGNNRQGFSDSHISGLPIISLVHAPLGAAPRFSDFLSNKELSPARKCRSPGEARTSVRVYPSADRVRDESLICLDC